MSSPGKSLLAPTGSPSRTPDQEPVAFAVSVLPDRLSLVIFTQDENGLVELFQYLPTLVPGEQFDSRQNLARFPVLQRSELIQRAYFAGRLEEPDQNAQELLYAKWIEPVAGALGGYILLTLNPQHYLLRTAVNNMSQYYPGLSDSHILNGVFHSLQETPSREIWRDFQRAYETGLPIFAEGLGRLKKAIEKTDIDSPENNTLKNHPQAEFFRQVHALQIPGIPWTAVPVAKLAEILG